MRQFAKKICLVGDFGVGKTSLVRRFVYNLFDDKYLATIGVKVSRKAIIVPSEKELVEVVMMIWDLAGTQEFEEMQATYLRGAAGVVIVCDLTRAETIERLPFYSDIVAESTTKAELVIAANKLDLMQSVAPIALEKYTTPLRAPAYLTSAKLGSEVDPLFQHLGSRLLN